MGEVGVVVAVVRSPVAAQLATGRGRGTFDAAGDLAYPQALAAQSGDALAFQARQEPVVRLVSLSARGASPPRSARHR